VDADEMTYPAHVILRFRLEQALIAGTLSVADLPGAWNDGFHSLLGMVPPDDARGRLQDIHWYDGAFGYFPSYPLGAMAAAPPTPPQTVDGEYHGTSTRFQAEKRTCPHPGLVRFDVIGRAFQFRWDGNTLVDATIGPDGTLSGGAERITLVGRQTNQKIEAD